MADNTSVDLARVPGDNPVAASPDLLRAMVQTFAEALMGADADALCGAPYGQPSADRVNYRNGYRPRPRGCAGAPIRPLPLFRGTRPDGGATAAISAGALCPRKPASATCAYTPVAHASGDGRVRDGQMARRVRLAAALRPGPG
jgi:Transposase, Mutator family